MSNPSLANRTGTMTMAPVARVDMAVTQLDMKIEQWQHIGAIPDLWIEEVVNDWMVSGESHAWFRTAVVLAWNALVAQRNTH